MSRWMYLMFCAAVALWWIYGLMLISRPIVLASGVTFGLTLVLLWYKWQDKAA